MRVGALIAQVAREVVALASRPDLVSDIVASFYNAAYREGYLDGQEDARSACEEDE